VRCPSASTTLGTDLNSVARAIQSVEAQTTDAEIELIVVDGSEDFVTQRFTDRAWETIDRLVVVTDPATGLSAARNVGFETATCEFVALLDDDRWYPEKLNRQLALFDHPDVGLVTCGVRRLFSDAGVRFDEDMPCYEDRDWYIRLSQHCEFDAVPEPLVEKGMHGDHLSSDADLALRAYPRFLAKYESLARLFGPDCLGAFRSSVYMLSVNGATNAGAYRAANRLAWKALRANPRNRTALFYFLATLGGEPTATVARYFKRTTVRLFDGLWSRPVHPHGVTDDRSRQSNS
jgi:glycosyltransferase involved in cell wall biosynthesis